MSQQLISTETLDSQRLLSVLTAINQGDLTRRLPMGLEGTAGAMAETLNMLLGRLESFAAEMNRITVEVAEGHFGGQAEVEGLNGTWKQLIDNLNMMSETLTNQVRDISRVTRGVVDGNPSRRVTVNAQGETLLLKELVNRLVDEFHARESQHPAGR
jgi:HAMP domain-containing protein